jgi:hypothetical protein
MRFFLRLALCALLSGLSLPLRAQSAQEADAPLDSLEASADLLPDAPAPLASPDPQQSSTSSQSPPDPATQPESQHEKAEEQLKEEERQRILGVAPNFNVSYRGGNAAPLTARQKMSLAFRSSIDPVTFAAALISAGYREALDDDPGFGWGAEGYGKRSGAAYLDAFDGTIIGNGILPSLLHQDPRYFRLGHGTATHRLLYSLASAVICKHDDPRRWEPNYSNIGGNIIAGAISNLYYPSSNSGAGQAIANGFTVTAEGTVANVFNEFWPDISRRFLHKDPTHGLDARADSNE